MSKNIVRARVTIRGGRPLLQHAFGPDALPLEKLERSGVAGNDPTEWKRTCMVTTDGQLFLRGSYVFSCVRDAAKHTKRGRGSIQADVAATLQVEESVVFIDRFLPKGEEPSSDPTKPVYVDICGVRNPATKGRNVRYRLACSPGWIATFILTWDKTIVDRELMKKVLRDAGTLVGIGDGRGVGNGRFEVLKFEELTEEEMDAEEATTEGGLGGAAPDRVGAGRKKVRPVRQAAEANRSAH